MSFAKKGCKDSGCVKMTFVKDVEKLRQKVTSYMSANMQKECGTTTTKSSDTLNSMTARSIRSNKQSSQASMETQSQKL
jgi:hypothetical protein